jgi:hypothetical protein
MDWQSGSQVDMHAILRENGLKMHQFCIDKWFNMHVFTLLQIPGTNGESIFKLYQGYIMEYSLYQYMQSKSFKKLTVDELYFTLVPMLEVSNGEDEWEQHHYDAFEKLFKFDLYTKEGQRLRSARSTYSYRAISNLKREWSEMTKPEELFSASGFVIWLHKINGSFAYCFYAYAAGAGYWSSSSNSNWRLSFSRQD